MDSVTMIRGVALLFSLVVCAVALVVAIFYLLSLSKTLSKCSPSSRTMEPGMVWLSLIPLFNIFWNFMVVLALAKSLANEFRARQIPLPEPEPGKTIGLALCICSICSIIPILGMFAGLASLVLWIVYWMKIVSYSRTLDQVPVLTGVGV